MLEESLDRTDDFVVGDSVTGVVVQIDDENIFVDISGKSEAVMAAAEFRAKDNQLTIKVGDRVKAHVVSTSHGEIQLTSSIGKGAANPELLKTAYSFNIPVHGTITAVIKGGYSVSVSGIKCFCPFSQIGIQSPETPESLIEQSCEFSIIEYAEKGKNIILSRRILLEEQIKEQEQHLKETLKEGDTVTGSVTSVKKFGIFIDLDGVEALVPRSELSRSRLVDISNFSRGETVTARVKSIDWENGRITLSIQDMTPDPWDTISRYNEGDDIQGTVVNIIKNGAFVEIEPGLEGFLHISRMNLLKKVTRPEDIVSVGDTLRIKITDIKTDERKIALDIIGEGASPWDNSEKSFSDTHTGTVEAIKPQGINVRLDNGMLGFVPRRELHIPSNSDIQNRYSAGNEINVAVIEIDTDKKKLILSEKKFLEMKEKKEYTYYKEKHGSGEGSTLGDLFKDKFNELQKNIEKK